MKDFNSEDSQEIMKKFKSIISSRLDKLYNDFDGGVGGELYAYSIAVNSQRNKQEKESAIEEPMDKETKLKEMIQAALSKPLSEKKGKDRDGDGDIDQQDYLIARDAAIKKAKGKVDEDMDLGHEDNEPHMLKADLYRIGKYAMELYKIVDQFEGEQEVDFPHWWQAKIINAKSCLVAAKHYLDFELKEPQIDAMVGVASEEGAIDEMSKKQTKKRGKVFDALKAQGMPDKKAGPIATSVAMKEEIKKAVLGKLKEK